MTTPQVSIIISMMALSYLTGALVEQPSRMRPMTLALFWIVDIAVAAAVFLWPRP